jgi:hypothetical protein
MHLQLRNNLDGPDYTSQPKDHFVIGPGIDGEIGMWVSI